ncbi:hypothetical protein MHB44_03585 [Lysinibacillus sp. FSL H8-0500]|uniref:hypothetical protein n=1 Tax=Lysinibacillus sp. FSL H8-0500 TaxID=2921393 RepID=UPI003100E0C2
MVVLTTASQTAEQEYTLSYRDEVIGGFKGVAAVIPTAIDITEKSQQGILGNNVTVKAQVTVGEGQSKAGIPVTFNIVNAQGNNLNPGGALNQPIIGEATTDENGVATYTYTRYASTARDLVTNDEVQAYATGKASVRSFAKVYWASIQPLAITEVTEGNTITNGGKKVYKVKLAGVSTNVTPGTTLDRTVNIGFKENVNVAPDKAVKAVTVTDANGRGLGYPGQFTTTNAVTTSTFNSVVLNLDHNGEATFTLTGSYATVTPFVFKDAYANTSNTDPSYGRFDETELFAQAPALTFSKQHTLQLTVDSLGVSNASAYDASFANGVVNYYYEQNGYRLYRDQAGNVASQAIATAPAGTDWISNLNPLRPGESTLGFAYTAQTPVSTTNGVASINNRLTNNLYRYTGNEVTPAKKPSETLADDLINTGGRDYKAVLKDKDGKLATTGTPIKVSVKYGSARTDNVAPIYVIDNNTYTVYRITDFTKTADKSTEEFNFATNAKGEISFTIIGGRDSYATPTVFVDSNNPSGLDAGDLQQAGEIVYFGDRTITSANLTVNDKAETNALVSEVAKFTYQTVDQNNKPYALNHNTTNGTQSREFVTSFEVKSGLGVAYVYSDEARTNLIGTINQDGTRTFTVTSVNGKAEIYVVSSVGNTVTVNASASQGTYPNKTASATFTNQFNEGVNSYVHGRVVAVDRVNNRVLVSSSTGKNIYELAYGSTDLQVAGQTVTEQSFEQHLQVGEELHFTAATDSKKAVFNNLNVASGVSIATDAVFVINGDQTSTAKTYDFGVYATSGNITGSSVNSPVNVAIGKDPNNPNTNTATQQELTFKELVINGDNITLANLNLNGDLVVGIPDGQAPKYYTTIQTVNDTTLSSTHIGGNTTVNRGDLNTFRVIDGSILRNVVLNIAEHVALDATSSITTLHAKVNGFAITGDGTLTNLILDSGVSQTTRPNTTLLDLTNTTITNNNTTGVPFSAVTTATADTITLTFSEAVTTSDVAVLELVTNNGTTTADTATLETTSDSKVVTIKIANSIDVQAKQFVVTYKNVEYLLAYDTTKNAWTVTKK